MTTELLFRNDAYLKEATATVIGVGERGIELDRTVFYPMGGGQAGDTGSLWSASGEHIEIIDTRKGERADQVVHVPAAAAAQLKPGDAVRMELDWARRH